MTDGIIAPARVRADGFSFTAGCNSYIHPAIIPDSGYRWGVNISHRGGIIQTRPGYRQRVNCSQTKLRLPNNYDNYFALAGCDPVFINQARGFASAVKRESPTPNLDYLWDAGELPYVTELPYGEPYAGNSGFFAPRAVPNIYRFSPLSPERFLFGEHPQMLAIFKPKNGVEELVWAVDGFVFVSKSNPDGTFQPAKRLEKIAFNARAKKLFSCTVVQSVSLGADGRVTPLPEPKTILVMQDGGLTRPAFYDGVDHGHLNPEPNWKIDTSGGSDDGSKIFSPLGNQVPLGSWMAWSGGRLWVAQGNRVYASDFNNPLYFTEAQFLNEVPFFTYPSEVTGLFDRGSSNFSASLLLVTTANSIHSLNSGLTNRAGSPQEAGWLNSPGFNKTLFQGIGCVSGDTIVAKNGLIWWMSRSGVVRWDGGQTVAVTQELPVLSSAMAESFMRISDGFMDGACGVAHEHYLLWSVPSGDLYNRDTWVYDDQPMGHGSGSWAGVWRGTNPAQWVSGTIQGVQRCYHISKDCDGQIRIWEAFTPERADNGRPIRWAFESKTHMVGGLFDLGVLKNFWVSLMEVYGRLDIKGYWRGMRGIYKENLTKRILATPGSFVARNLPVTNSTAFESYLPQSRVVRSQEIFDSSGSCTSCGVESPLADATDRGFSIQIIGEGRAAIEGYRLHIAPAGQTNQGQCEESEDGYRIVRACACPIREEVKLPADIQYLFGEANRSAAFTPIQPKACDVEYCSPPDDPAVPDYPTQVL